MEDHLFPKLILTDGFGEQNEWEITQKGWFCAIVEIEDGCRYEINFYDPVRLMQEYNDIIYKFGEMCFIEFNIIIVPTVTLDLVRKCIQHLWDKNYFNFIQAEKKP